MAALARSNSSIQRDLISQDSIDSDSERYGHKNSTKPSAHPPSDPLGSYILQGSGQSVAKRLPQILPELSPNAASAPRYSHMALKGSDAIAEQRLLLKEKTREEVGQKSPNPSMVALKALTGGDTAMSAAKNGLPSAVTSISEPVAMAVKATSAADSLDANNNSQTNSVPHSAVSGTADAFPASTSIAHSDATIPAAINVEGATPISIVAAADHQGPSSLPAAPTGDDSSPANRSFTFPPPLSGEGEHKGPSRGLSMPTAGYGQGSPRSPSTRRHKCPYCSTDFTRHHNLKSHLLTHSQEKPYECPTCRAKFRRLHDLKRHTKLHTGERPHKCPRCGRPFARGDALARHNKGQGGCPGRRSSFGDNDFGEGRMHEENMEGIQYAVEGAEDDRLTVDSLSGERRRGTEPGQKQLSGHSYGIPGDSGPGDHSIYRSHSSSYPPLNPRVSNNDNRSLFPGSSHSNTSHVPPVAAANREPSSMNRREPGTVNMPPTQFGPGQASMYAHGSMTESPKPLSPGQSEGQHRLGISETGSMQHPIRSPSVPQQMPHTQHYVRPGTGSVSSPMGLHPPSGSPNPPQLPSLPGLEPKDMRAPMTNKISNSQGSGGRNAGSGSNVLHQRSSRPSPTSNPGSLSGHSYGQSSAGSMRDILSGGNGNSGGRDFELWPYIRELESRIARMQDEYENRVSQLHEEVGSLKSQLLQQQQQQQQQHQHKIASQHQGQHQQPQS